MRDEIKNKVIEIIAEIICIDSSEITEDKNLLEDLEIASLEIMELLCQLEDELDIQIDSSESSKLVYVRDVIDFIVEKMGSN